MKLLTLFQFLFPSWRLFEKYGHIPQLYWRTHQKQSEVQTQNWQIYSTKRTTTFFNLFFNPNHNLNLKFQSNLQQFMEFLSKNHSEHTVINSALYKIINSALQTNLPLMSYYQFKLVILSDDPRQALLGLNTQDLMISSILQYKDNTIGTHNDS